MSHGYTHRAARDHIVDFEVMKLERRAAAARRPEAAGPRSQRDLVVASLLRHPDARDAGRSARTRPAA